MRRAGDLLGLTLEDLGGGPATGGAVSRAEAAPSRAFLAGAVPRLSRARGRAQRKHRRELPSRPAPVRRLRSMRGGIVGREASPGRSLREFVYALKDLGLSAATIRRQVSAIRTYYGFLLAEGRVEDDPSDRLEMPRRGRRLPDTLAVAEMEAMLAAPAADEPLAWRDRALLELGYGAGLRVSELCGLALTDLLLTEGLVRVFGQGLEGAAGADRPQRDRRGLGVPAPGAARRSTGASSRDRVLLNARGEPLSRVGAWGIVKRAPERRASRKRVTPHTLRHTLRHAPARRAAPTSGPCRRCWDTPTSPPPRSTPTWTASTSARSIASTTRAGDGRTGASCAPRAACTAGLRPLRAAAPRPAQSGLLGRSPGRRPAGAPGPRFPRGRNRPSAVGRCGAGLRRMGAFAGPRASGCPDRRGPRRHGARGCSAIAGSDGRDRVRLHRPRRQFPLGPGAHRALSGGARREARRPAGEGGGGMARRGGGGRRAKPGSCRRGCASPSGTPSG